MAADDESVRRGVKIVRWSIAVVFAVAVFTVDSPSALFGGAALGWLFSAVERYMGAGQAGSPSAQNLSPQGSAWKPTAKTKTAVHASGGPPSLWESGKWPPPDAAIDSGGGLSFTYADANGEVTERRIINWNEDPEYDHCFTGWCTAREEPRTFRIDRVQSWG
jgi:hypothetical protein